MAHRKIPGITTFKRQARKFLGEQHNRPIRVFITVDGNFKPPEETAWGTWVIQYSNEDVTA